MPSGYECENYRPFDTLFAIVVWLWIQKFGNMDHSLWLVPPVKSAIDVGDAAGIARNDDRCAAGFDMGDFAFHHSGRDFWVLNREYAAKTAALISTGQLYEFPSFDVIE